jgi:hypothetical protein
MEGKITHKKLVLEHMRRFGSIEPMIALREYGCYRLGARIGDLRAEGYNIVTEMMTRVSTITGHPVRFANYKLIE